MNDLFAAVASRIRQAAWTPIPCLIRELATVHLRHDDVGKKKSHIRECFD